MFADIKWEATAINSRNRTTNVHPQPYVNMIIKTSKNNYKPLINL